MSIAEENEITYFWRLQKAVALFPLAHFQIFDIDRKVTH